MQQEGKCPQGEVKDVDNTPHPFNCARDDDTPHPYTVTVRATRPNQLWLLQSLSPTMWGCFPHCSPRGWRMWTIHRTHVTFRRVIWWRMWVKHHTPNLPVITIVWNSWSPPAPRRVNRKPQQCEAMACFITSFYLFILQSKPRMMMMGKDSDYINQIEKLQPTLQQ